MMSKTGKVNPQRDCGRDGRSPWAAPLAQRASCPTCVPSPPAVAAPAPGGGSWQTPRAAKVLTWGVFRFRLSSLFPQQGFFFFNLLRNPEEGTSSRVIVENLFSVNVSRR